MKQITFSDKQFYDLLQFTSEYTGNILERASEEIREEEEELGYYE